ncbi:hypothetical protein CC1G_15364 [Coprinopsis cinerea okayama7|uniref:Uncharacterized protein n=1 Tax=Coprinopsis cinerea (strain Okayama-7 / 130 / ATCC MYA-4618 / FGSC 9003) TaxID=240176 RepID=D6RQ43_COPC7|nr:hypothetical protein CC1G_15364 [Coprinopsis cinerea okayama7\|eukprot:XP_002910457.1 hypothetical protein CC1G_15364 [Coprinopsis cinerea okayama7\
MTTPTAITNHPSSSSNANATAPIPATQYSTTTPTAGTSISAYGASKGSTSTPDGNNNASSSSSTSKRQAAKRPMERRRVGRRSSAEPLVRLGTPSRDSPLNIQPQTSPVSTTDAQSISAVIPSANGGAAQGRQRATSVVLPEPDKPWKHPSELLFICRDDWPQDMMISYLTQNVFSVPPRDTRPTRVFASITSRDGTTTLLPKGYRIPLMFVAKFQWESLRLVLTSSDPEKEWDEFKFDIVHLSRLCSHLLKAARKAAMELPYNSPAGTPMKSVKGDRVGSVDRNWRFAMFDRALTRFYRKWMVGREWSLRRFWEDYGEEEYEADVLKHDWARWVLKGHKGFLLTKEEVDNGITAEQFMAGLGQVGGKWVWDNDLYVQARSIAMVGHTQAQRQVEQQPQTKQEPVASTSITAPLTAGPSSATTTRPTTTTQPVTTTIQPPTATTTASVAASSPLSSVPISPAVISAPASLSVGDAGMKRDEIIRVKQEEGEGGVAGLVRDADGDGDGDEDADADADGDVEMEDVGTANGAESTVVTNGTTTTTTATRSMQVDATATAAAAEKDRDRDRDRAEGMQVDGGVGAGAATLGSGSTATIAKDSTITTTTATPTTLKNSTTTLNSTATQGVATTSGYKSQGTTATTTTAATNEAATARLSPIPGLSISEGPPVDEALSVQKAPVDVPMAASVDARMGVEKAPVDARMGVEKEVPVDALIAGVPEEDHGIPGLGLSSRAASLSSRMGSGAASASVAGATTASKSTTTTTTVLGNKRPREEGGTTETDVNRGMARGGEGGVKEGGVEERVNEKEGEGGEDGRVEGRPHHRRSIDDGTSELSTIAATNGTSSTTPPKESSTTATAKEAPTTTAPTTTPPEAQSQTTTTTPPVVLPPRLAASTRIASMGMSLATAREKAASPAGASGGATAGLSSAAGGGTVISSTTTGGTAPQSGGSGIVVAGRRIPVGYAVPNTAGGGVAGYGGGGGGGYGGGAGAGGGYNVVGTGISAYGSQGAWIMFFEVDLKGLIGSVLSYPFFLHMNMPIASMCIRACL